MTYVFSPSNKNFYPTELEAEYRKSNTWPSDGIEVSDDVFNQFSGTPPEGKTRGWEQTLCQHGPISQQKK